MNESVSSDDVEDVPHDSVQLAAPGRAGAGWSKERRGVALALVLVCLGALVLGVFSTRSILADGQRADDREQILEVVGDFATAVVTIDSETVADDLARIASFTTGDLEDSLKDNSDAQAALIDQLKVIGEGTVTESGVQKIDDGTAIALVSLRAEQTLENSAGGTQEIGYRMRIRLDETGDGWKVEKVDFVP